MSNNLNLNIKFNKDNYMKLKLIARHPELVSENSDKDSDGEEYNFIPDKIKNIIKNEYYIFNDFMKCLKIHRYDYDIFNEEMSKNNKNKDYNDIVLLKDYIYNDLQMSIPKSNTTINEHRRNQIKAEYGVKECEFKKNNPNKKLVYDNQKLTAEQVINEFNNNNKIAISLISLPQVGKTGTFLYIAYLMAIYNDDNKVINPENIFIITGMSDLDWQSQTKSDMLPSFQNNVYHHGQLDGFKENYKKRNGKKLIIIDESHIAVKKNQKMDKIVCDILDINGIKDIVNMKDVLILSVSATPGITLKDLRNFGDFHSEIFIKQSDNYVGFKDFIDQNRIEKSENISEKFLDTINKKIKDRYNKNYKYHIIRASTKYHKIINNFCKNNNYKFFHHNSQERQPEFDKMIENKPKNHTFIIIKQFYRAGKRFNDTHIGITYEHSCNINMESTPQGLVGRFCGNNKIFNQNDSPYFYCNMEAIKNYISHFDKDCNFDNYESTNLRIKENIIIKRNKTTLSRIYNSDYKIDEGFNTQEEFKNETENLPIVINVDKEVCNKFEKLKDKSKTNDEERFKILKPFIKQNKDLDKFINELNYKKLQISQPSSDNSYTKHIVAGYNAYKDNKKWKIDVDKEYIEENVWMAFIDNVESNIKHFKDNQLKIIFMIYHGKKYAELKNNLKNINNNQTIKTLKKIEKK